MGSHSVGYSCSSPGISGLQGSTFRREGWIKGAVSGPMYRAWVGREHFGWAFLISSESLSKAQTTDSACETSLYFVEM